MSRPLGSNQISVLRSLRDYSPYPGGWFWDNHSGTVRILESLVKRGLVDKKHPNPRLRAVYTINDAGKQNISERSDG